MSLSVRALAFGFRDRIVGQAVDFDVGHGEAVCVLGPNGAGKSTLFRTILGLLPPIEGQVTIDGEDLATLGRGAIARALAYVPQSSAIAFDFTLHEIVTMGRTAHLGPFAAPGRADLEISRAALERLGIGALADRLLGEVSGGERQLALIARALASEARAIVMDEPTASLDFGNRARVLDEIRRLEHAGIAVLFCTHDPDQAFLADRVLLLEAGRVLAYGPTRSVLTADHLSQLYRVPVDVADGIVRARPGGAFAAGPPLS
jgi:iron complex transport system ATP-binding protein